MKQQMDENKNKLIILWYNIRASKGQPTLTKYNRRQVLDPMCKTESKPLIGLVQQREKRPSTAKAAVFLFRIFSQTFSSGFVGLAAAAFEQTFN